MLESLPLMFQLFFFFYFQCLTFFSLNSTPTIKWLVQQFYWQEFGHKMCLNVEAL